MKKVLYAYLICAILVGFEGCKKKATNTTDTTLAPVVQTTPWPEWIFHHWIWEGSGTSTSARQIVAGYEASGIPVGAIIIDSPWETDYNTFSPDSSLYPDMQAMINEFHAKNIHVLLWITGFIDTSAHPLYDYALGNHFFMQANASSGPTVVSWWQGKGCLIDLYNPAAIAWVKSLMDTVLNMGIDGWKCDGSDFSSISVPYSPYLGANMPSRNDYSDKYYELFHDYTRQKLGNTKANTFRPIDNYGYGIGGDPVAFAPKAIGWSCWVGDQDATFTGLTKALNNMYFSDQYGYLGFGSDIGGYRTDATYPATGRSETLFIRWAQLGAFCGLMENGGGGEHRPWMFDAQTDSIYKKFVLLREQMVPYLMKTATQRYEAQKAMMNFFNQTDYSYILGDDIFVSPILDATSNVNVKFPAGSNWVYLFDKTKVYTGGSTVLMNFSLDQFPVFAKQGSSVLASLNP